MFGGARDGRTAYAVSFGVGTRALPREDSAMLDPVFVLSGKPLPVI